MMTWKNFRKNFIWYSYQYGVVLLLSIVLLFLFLRPKETEGEDFSLRRYAVNGRQFEKQLAGKTETDTLLTEENAGLLFNGYEVPLEKDTQVFYISQPLKGGWQGELEPYHASLSVLADEYLENLPEAVSSGHIFQAVLSSGKRYQKVGIVLTGMPLVSISTEREEPQEYPIEDIDNYVFNSETRYYGEITIFQSGALSPESETGEGAKEEYQILQEEVCYHERGQNSALFDKKSYAVKLLGGNGKGEARPLFGMKSSAKWKLLAMYSDPNKIRDKVSMELWKEIAEGEESFNERGPEMEYCEVILDGEYLGLYGMMLPVNEDTLGLDRTDVLYKVMDWYMPEEADILSSIEQNYEVSYPVRIRYPEKTGTVEKMWEPIRRYFTCKYWSLDFQAYGDMVCVENLADFYIFIQTTAGFDNYLKNTYIVARRADNESGYKMITIPWDLNYTFGNCYVYDPDNNYTGFNGDATVNYAEPVQEQLFRSSYNGEADVLKERWMRYRADILRTEHITGLLQDNMDYLQETGAFGRDTEKWKEAGNSTDLTEVKNYVEERMRYLDEYFHNF